jgi:hypothetical protein
MRLAIVGASGFVGRHLVGARLLPAGHEVCAFTRDGARARSVLGAQVRTFEWDTSSPLPKDALKGFDAVINLAGENVASRRWTAAVKREIRDSRLRTTAALVEALAAASPRPQTFINASAIGYYGPRGEEEISESAPAGGDFLAEICREWEEAATHARTAGVRTIVLRVGIVLGLGGGALAKMLLPFRMGLGGPLGSGRQWMSWIHLDDLAGMIEHALSNASICGPLNGTAPRPVTNREFSRTLGRVLRRPAVLPMPALALRLVVGEFAEILLKGQRVVPQRALETGFRFRFADLEPALRDLLGSRGARA